MPEPLRVGLTTDPAHLQTAISGFPGIALCRVFGTFGLGLPAWNSPPMRLLHQHRITAWVSFKDWTSDRAAIATVTAWLDTLPVDVDEVWLTWHHEPEGDLSSPLYRRNWLTLTDTVRAHRFSKRVKLVPIHNLYPARHKNTAKMKYVGDWHKWAPQHADGTYTGDYMGWDCYLESTAQRYESPESFFAIPVASAAACAVPLVIPELGALRLATDGTGTGRARWINDCLTYLAEHEARAVLWWHAIGSAGQDYRLTDNNSADIWRKALAGLY